MFANSSPVSSISEPLAAALGIKPVGHIFVSGFRTPTFPVSAPSKAMDVAFVVKDSTGVATTRSVKIAPVFFKGRAFSLVLGRDWMTSFIELGMVFQEYGPARSFLRHYERGDKVDLEWGIPDRGPGYNPDSYDMGHAVRPDRAGMLKLLAIAGRPSEDNEEEISRLNELDYSNWPVG